jgi:hypothetical protein
MATTTAERVRRPEQATVVRSSRWGNSAARPATTFPPSLYLHGPSMLRGGPWCRAGAPDRDPITRGTPPAISTGRFSPMSFDLSCLSWLTAPFVPSPPCHGRPLSRCFSSWKGPASKTCKSPSTTIGFFLLNTIAIWECHTTFCINVWAAMCEQPTTHRGCSLIFCSKWICLCMSVENGVKTAHWSCCRSSSDQWTGTPCSSSLNI